MLSTKPAHAYEVRPRRDKRGFDLISVALPFGRLWYTNRMMQSDTRRTAANHITPRSAFRMMLAT